MGPNPPCENDTLCGDWRGRCPKTVDFLRFLICARDTLCGDWRGLFTISHSSCTSTTPIPAERRARTSKIVKDSFCASTTPIPAEGRARKSEIVKSPARATSCGDWRGRCAKTGGFLRFLTCPREDWRGGLHENAGKMLLFQVGTGLRVCLVVTRLLLAVAGPELESCLVSAAFKLESQQRESGSQRVHLQLRLKSKGCHVAASAARRELARRTCS